jgi:hypothetical protein
VPEERDVKKIYKWKLIASRQVGRPKIRSTDNVMKDISAMKVISWKGEHGTEINRSQLLSRPTLMLSYSA